MINPNKNKKNKRAFLFAGPNYKFGLGCVAHRQSPKARSELRESEILDGAAAAAAEVLNFIIRQAEDAEAANEIGGAIIYVGGGGGGQQQLVAVDVRVGVGVGDEAKRFRIGSEAAPEPTGPGSAPLPALRLHGHQVLLLQQLQPPAAALLLQGVPPLLDQRGRATQRARGGRLPQEQAHTLLLLLRKHLRRSLRKLLQPWPWSPQFFYYLLLCRREHRLGWKSSRHSPPLGTAAPPASLK